MTVYLMPPRPPQPDPLSLARPRTAKDVLKARRVCQLSHLGLLAYVFRHYPQTRHTIALLSRAQLLAWLEARA